MTSKYLQFVFRLFRTPLLRIFKLGGSAKMLVEDEELIMAVDESWSNDYSVTVKGWLISKKEKPDQVEIGTNNHSVPIVSWHSRPDVAIRYPQYNTEDCGFVVYLPRLIQHQLKLTTFRGAKTYQKELIFEGHQPKPPANQHDHAGGLFSNFIEMVNRDQQSILEIGSRIVSPGSASKRNLFPNSKSYTGFDYYSDRNTDVVGDAHKLSQYFGDQKFGAIFSLSVFEHLAMPWVVAAEISKLLEVGGITFHSSHFDWPLHATPWDFWRFSDEGFKVLFPPALGFEIIKAGLFSPLRLHLDEVGPGQELLAKCPGYGGVAILAKKIKDVSYDRVKWDLTLEDVLDQNSHYPKQ
jgi:hypothetical protein